MDTTARAACVPVKVGSEPMDIMPVRADRWPPAVGDGVFYQRRRKGDALWEHGIVRAVRAVEGDAVYYVEQV